VSALTKFLYHLACGERGWIAEVPTIWEICLDALRPNIDAMLELAFQLVLCQLEADVHRAKQELYEMIVPIKILLLKDLADDGVPCDLSDF